MTSNIMFFYCSQDQSWGKILVKEVISYNIAFLPIKVTDMFLSYFFFRKIKLFVTFALNLT